MTARWPAMMTRETAAEYCDMSAEQFDRQCPVAPIDQGWRGLRWKKTKLDAWIEALPEKPRRASQTIGGQALDAAAPAANDETPPLDAEARRRRSLTLL